MVAVVSPKPWYVFIELNTTVPEKKILLKHLLNSSIILLP